MHPRSVSPLVSRVLRRPYSHPFRTVVALYGAVRGFQLILRSSPLTVSVVTKNPYCSHPCHGALCP